MEKKKDIKLIVSDIEGCITSGKGQYFDLDIFKFLMQYNKNSRKFRRTPPLTVCTGRSQPYVEAISQALGIFMPSVCENGALIYFPLEDEIRINPRITKSMLNDLGKVKKILYEKIVGKIEGAKIEPGKEVCISLNPPKGMSIIQFHKIIKEEIKEFLKILNVTHSKSAVDITPIDINKGSGVVFLSNITKIPVESMLGIGDSVGDLSFLKIVGTKATPKNGMEEVKKMADYTASEENGRGLKEIINKLVLR